MWCPGCNATQVLRSDSGLCERCHAVQPETRAEWEAWRQECAQREVRRWESLPEGSCTLCHGPWRAPTQEIHDRYCPAKRFVCECTRRFSDNNGLVTHKRFNTCGGLLMLGRLDR